MERHIFSVTEVNELVKLLLDNEPMLSGICVRGEISNYKMYPSGHHYFSLKDPTGAIRCVMFKGQALRLRFRPENGMKVLVTGRVSVFPRDGAYQLYCDTMTPEGAGDLALAFEQLKKQLYKEGLFDEAHKKPLPRFPERIAIVTSSAGAAIHDMIRILRRRYPLAKVILLPVRVQGAEAPPEIAGAIRYADKWKIGDVIITGRGGGSMEDLWAFNDERVARAIYACETPVISAVGHEPDVTISDFVADARASTPSNAAEIAVPDQVELRRQLSDLAERMTGQPSIPPASPAGAGGCAGPQTGPDRPAGLRTGQAHGTFALAAAPWRSGKCRDRTKAKSLYSSCGVTGCYESLEGSGPGLRRGPERGRAGAEKQRGDPYRRADTCDIGQRRPDRRGGSYRGGAKWRLKN